MDVEMIAILEGVAEQLSRLGVAVDRGVRPEFDFADAWQTGGWLIGAACNISERERDVSHNEWLLADRQRARRRQAWAEFFERVDVLLCPITLTPAFLHQQQGTWAEREVVVNGSIVPYLALEAWPALIGSAYLPSTSAPVGQTSGGLPVGVQVVSPFLHDYRSIAVAGLISDLVGGYAVPPIAR
jgi:amidase